MKTRLKSEALFQDSKKHLVGGVNSPVRAYPGYDFAPPFINKAKGAYLWDEDGEKYIDYVASWGPMILGHAHSEVVKAIQDAAEEGTSYGAPTVKENKLAELVKNAFPSIDLIRFVSSGTEATMSAIRAARGFTKRDKIIKFEGCYHGHSDYLLVKAGSGAATFSKPSSSGVPEDFAKHTLIAEYNNLESVKDLIDKNSDQVAAIIVEPIAGNMGCVTPAGGFLEGLRSLCDRNNIVLIFDEVITGFRVSFGGAQEYYGVRPDLTCLGKILGGGLPMGAYGGKREIMKVVAPLGSVYQAGTLSGNPIAVSAGIATIKVLNDLWPYDQLKGMTDIFLTQASSVLKEKGIKHHIQNVGSMFTIFFREGEVENYQEAESQNRQAFDQFFVHMLDNGIYLAPSPFESSFISLAHTNNDIEKTIEALKSL